MIVVTRLNGTRFAVNPDILERIHESPDTHLVTLDGAAYVVRESLAEVVELIANYRASVLRRAHDLPAVTGYPLSLVRSPEPEPEPEPEPGTEDGPGTNNHPNGT
ncbi:flagellar FlbD family protein [Paenarthrobacter nitroguajacolicus]|uniref:flagellar FlbD family protein n=1 Tax=Paenarthrobacter nitroguajacolicus TaxID=211146 RepID=UPI00285B50FE|nr:flagellar FlbD family protein [Paenarthrobacter nitroguajacolicus]MDR6637216.1 flagellar protein FlbD [Paenarthrobacter nitroguajacolicus]